MFFARIVVLAVVLLMLAALILPALVPATGGGRVFHVQCEMEAMSSSITKFRERFGISPPSRFVLHETSSYWSNSQRDRGIIRQMWPAFDFTTDHDFNGDGDTSDRFELTGAECLVFFLSGVGCSMDQKTGHISSTPRGFSKNVTSPFELDSDQRDGPYFDFVFGRFIDVDGDGFPEYLPPFPSAQTPYLYLSSYDGRGYRKQDSAVYLPGDERNAKDLYYKDKSYKVPYNSDSFQIICAGRDDRFGTGGYFEVETIDEIFVGNRKFEHDNITNFHVGTLGDPREKKNWFGFSMMSVCLLLGVGFILLLIRSLRRSRSCLESGSG